MPECCATKPLDAVSIRRRDSLIAPVVRPERRDVLAGASPVRVSAGAPGSRLRPEGEIRPSQAECRKPLKERGANQRAATTGERCSHVIVSAERCLGGPSRSFHGEGNRQQARSRTLAGPLRGCEAAARWNRRMRNRRDPTWQPALGKDRAYKAGRLKSREARRESEGFVVPRNACKTTRWREGALL